MGSFSPPQIALLIVGALSAVGLIVGLVRNSNTYSGYQEFAQDARSIARTMSAEVFRDADDVVISGNFTNLPTIVRFSNAESTPGLNIRVQAPATFTLTVTPKKALDTGGGRVVGRTDDPQFDARFTIRSEQATEARMFLAPRTVALLKRLCCSSETQVSVSVGMIELSEMAIPVPGTAHHVIEHLKQISTLAESFREMPGAEKVKIVPFKRDRHWAARIAMAVGATAALVTVFNATGAPGRQQESSTPAASSGIMPIDAAAIRDVGPWRLAGADDFDAVSQNWMRGNNLQPEGRITGDFSGNGLGTDVAYLLVREDGARRVVLLSAGAVRYDAQFPSLGGVARLPKDSVASIEWVGGKAPEPIDGDGLLLIRHGDDGTSPLALFLRAGNPAFASPAKYDSINLR